MDVAVSRGRILVRGRGLRPKVYVEAFAFENGKGVTRAKFRGKGIWRPIVAILRGVAMSALKKLELNADIPSVLRGEILASRTATPKPGTAPPATPTPGPAAAPPPPGPSFLDLVEQVRIRDSSIVAFPGKPLALGEMVRFQTATGSELGFPLRVTVDQGRFRPGRSGAPAKIELAGRVDGEIQDGSLALGGVRSTFSRGELRGGTYRLRSEDSGRLETEMGALSFGLDWTFGDFRVPGAPRSPSGPPRGSGFGTFTSPRTGPTRRCSTPTSTARPAASPARDR